jgi:hypothetical protein
MEFATNPSGMIGEDLAPDFTQRTPYKLQIPERFLNVIRHLALLGIHVI